MNTIEDHAARDAVHALKEALADHLRGAVEGSLSDHLPRALEEGLEKSVEALEEQQQSLKRAARKVEQGAQSVPSAARQAVEEAVQLALPQLETAARAGVAPGVAALRELRADLDAAMQRVHAQADQVAVSTVPLRAAVESTRGDVQALEARVVELVTSELASRVGAIGDHVSRLDASVTESGKVAKTRADDVASRLGELESALSKVQPGLEALVASVAVHHKQLTAVAERQAQLETALVRLKEDAQTDRDALVTSHRQQRRHALVATGIQVLLLVVVLATLLLRTGFPA